MIEYFPISYFLNSNRFNQWTDLYKLFLLTTKNVFYIDDILSSKISLGYKYNFLLNHSLVDEELKISLATNIAKLIISYYGDIDNYSSYGKSKEIKSLLIECDDYLHVERDKRALNQSSTIIHVQKYFYHFILEDKVLQDKLYELLSDFVYLNKSNKIRVNYNTFYNELHAG